MKVFYLPVLSLLLFSAVIYFPAFGGLFVPFSPLVLLLYLADYGREKSSDLLFLGILAVCMVFQPYITLYYIATIAFTAYIIYSMSGNEKSSWLPVVLAPVPALAVSSFIVYMMEGLRDEMVALVTDMLMKIIEAAKNAPPESTASSYALVVENNIDLAALSMVLASPGLIFVAVVLIAYFTKTFFYKIKKAEHEVFRLPDNYVWFMLGGLAFFFAGDPILRSLAFNTLLIFTSLYFIQGFEVMRHWLNRFKLHVIFKAIIYIIVFSEPPLMLGLSLAGLFSIWFNLFGKPPAKTGDAGA